MKAFPTRSFLALLSVALLLIGCPLSAQADRLDDLAQRVGVRSAPTDYLLVVDTSSSMQQGGRWGAVRQALAALARDLDRDDRVTLITFDNGVRNTWRATSPTPEQLLAQLPQVPTGTQTDIGAALEAGLTQLEQHGTSQVAAVVLLTDGQLDAATDSDFPTASAPAWAELRRRADRLASTRQIGAFAVSVGEQTDAKLLTTVFPQASVASPDDIAGYLSGLSRELTKVRVGQVLAADLKTPVKLTVEPVTSQGGVLTGQVKFASATTQLPITITGLTTPAGSGLTVTMTPTSVELAPKATGSARFTITGTPKGRAAIVLVATLGSPWAKDLAAAGLSLPTVRSAPLTILEAAAPTTPAATATATEPEVVPIAAGPRRALWLAALGALVVAALVPMLIWVIRSRRPSLDGSIALTGAEGEQDELLLVGTGVSARRAGVGLRVTGRKDGRIQVRARVGRHTTTATLADGQTLQLGEGRELRFTSERSRMLDMVAD